MARLFLACGHYAERSGIALASEAECPWGCGVQAAAAPIAGLGQIIDDIPEHMNPAFPVPVHGRRQLKQLQEKFGTSDFEPSAKTRERLAESRERVLHGR